MLYISLILSAFLLLIANGIAWRVRIAGPTMVCFILAFLIGPLFLFCVFPAVMLQSLLLCGAAIVWRMSRRGPSFFLPLSCGATLVAYGVSGIMVLNSEREYKRLRILYPYESMEVRLPPPKPAPSATPLPPAATQRLSRLEGELANKVNSIRESQLMRLHERAVALFINSPGFGIARMLRPSDWSLAAYLRREPVPLQPGSRFTSMWSPGEFEQPPAGDQAPLSRMLDDSILDFAYPWGFGYFKDRRHVAGFETHRFSQIPAPANRWTVQNLELVGLLLHDEPQVYVSASLPRMDQLHGTPTRPLDRFEWFGLDALQHGEDIFVAQDVEGVRMLGAVRSTKRCVACHGGNRGDLLGAFSYTLRSEEPQTPGEESDEHNVQRALAN